MFSSTQKFIINGDENKNLKSILELAFKLSDDIPETYTIDPVKGIIFYWDEDIGKPLTGIPSTFKEQIDFLCDRILEYLEMPEVKKIYDSLREKENKNGCFIDGLDGIIENGWEVFLPISNHINEKYGIEDSSSAIIGVRPTLIFYGK